MDCPNCGLINPEGAGACDCGYSFELGRSLDPDADHKRAHKLFKRKRELVIMFVGLAALIGGALAFFESETPRGASDLTRVACVGHLLVYLSCGVLLLFNVRGGAMVGAAVAVADALLIAGLGVVGATQSPGALVRGIVSALLWGGISYAIARHTVEYLAAARRAGMPRS